jgi:hypothetical protein
MLANMGFSNKLQCYRRGIDCIFGISRSITEDEATLVSRSGLPILIAECHGLDPQIGF